MLITPILLSFASVYMQFLISWERERETMACIHTHTHTHIYTECIASTSSASVSSTVSKWPEFPVERDEPRKRLLMPREEMEKERKRQREGRERKKERRTLWKTIPKINR